MSKDYSAILLHPDKEEIISKLMTGVSHKNIADWLKLQYPNKDQSHLRIGASLLKDFADNSLDLFNQLRNDIVAVKNNTAVSKSMLESVRNNKTYKERLNELADTEIDIKRVITETIVLMRARIEQMYDIVQSNPENLKPDYALMKWFEVLLNATEKYHKVYNEAPTVVNQNITVNMVEQHTAILQEAIRDTMAEIDPNIAFLFMDKLNERLAKIQAPMNEILPQDKRAKEAEILFAKANEVNNELS